jgi:hypothetical protein
MGKASKDSAISASVETEEDLLWLLEPEKDSPPPERPPIPPALLGRPAILKPVPEFSEPVPGVVVFGVPPELLLSAGEPAIGLCGGLAGVGAGPEHDASMSTKASRLRSAKKRDNTRKEGRKELLKSVIFATSSSETLTIMIPQRGAVGNHGSGRGNEGLAGRSEGGAGGVTGAARGAWERGEAVGWRGNRR